VGSSGRNVEKIGEEQPPTHNDRALLRHDSRPNVRDTVRIRERAKVPTENTRESREMETTRSITVVDSRHSLFVSRDDLRRARDPFSNREKPRRSRTQKRSNCSMLTFDRSRRAIVKRKTLASRSIRGSILNREASFGITDRRIKRYIFKAPLFKVNFATMY
jgi:hypothetical protein